MAKMEFHRSEGLPAPTAWARGRQASRPPGRASGPRDGALPCARDTRVAACASDARGRHGPAGGDRWSRREGLPAAGTPADRRARVVAPPGPAGGRAPAPTRVGRSRPPQAWGVAALGALDVPGRPARPRLAVALASPGRLCRAARLRCQPPCPLFQGPWSSWGAVYDQKDAHFSGSFRPACTITAQALSFALRRV